MLSPIGFVTIPPAVTQRSRSGYGLSGAEIDMLARVPETGSALLANIPRLESVARIVRYQHKNFDGSGLPSDSCSGEDIPLGARILKVLSDLLQFEAKGVAKFKALEQMQRRGGWYDPRVLDATFACFDIYLPVPTATSGKPVELKDLQTGQTLLREVRTVDDLLIVSAGTQVTPLLLQRLRNFAQSSGIKEPVYVKEATRPQATPGDGS